MGFGIVEGVGLMFLLGGLQTAILPMMNYDPLGPFAAFFSTAPEDADADTVFTLRSFGCMLAVMGWMFMCVTWNKGNGTPVGIAVIAAAAGIAYNTFSYDASVFVLRPEYMYVVNMVVLGLALISKPAKADSGKKKK